MKKLGTLAYDVETYRDYFLLSFLNIDTSNVVSFELYEGHSLDIEKIKTIMRSYRIISFNGINYDLPIISLALTGASNIMLKKASDRIIKNNLKPWIVAREMNFRIMEHLDHIDLIEVAPGRASLKLYGGRMHSQKLQELPIEPDASISPDDRVRLRVYNVNDLHTTKDLFLQLLPQIELREKMTKEYAEDLRSKSDAQIAEAVIKKRIGDATGVKPTRPEIPEGTRFRYHRPKFIMFATPELQAMLDEVERATFYTGAGGKVIMPKELDNRVVTIAGRDYRMGIGGLHSCEASACHRADEDHVILDRDVASYYPSIILGCDLFPRHLGEQFLAIYKQIVERRLHAKHTGDKVTADSLKITINGSFGKFGSVWSALYSPNLLIQTTLTGQLALLMLIERVTSIAGVEVISANTDGIVIKSRKDALEAVENSIFWWECVTGFDTEETRYKALYSRDVNNYIAVKEKGGYKTKGTFVPPGLSKNPSNEICAEAVIKFLIDGTPIEETIISCRDIKKFLTVRTVSGGAVHEDGAYIGKVCRWYYSKNATGVIRYKINGKKVPLSDGAMPLMELPPELPGDIEYARYIQDAYDYLVDLGVNPKKEKPKCRKAKSSS